MVAPDSADPYESAACGLLTLAPDGRIRRANATFCKWLGWDVTELVGAKRFQDLLTVGCKLFHQTHWMPLLQLQGSVAVLEDAQRRPRAGAVAAERVRLAGVLRRRAERCGQRCDGLLGGRAEGDDA